MLVMLPVHGEGLVPSPSERGGGGEALINADG